MYLPLFYLVYVYCTVIRKNVCVKYKETCLKITFVNKKSFIVKSSQNLKYKNKQNVFFYQAEIQYSNRMLYLKKQTIKHFAIL